MSTTDSAGSDIEMRRAGHAFVRRATQRQLAELERFVTIGMLSAGVAHDLNGPLAATLCNLDGVVDDLTLLADSLRRRTGPAQAPEGGADAALAVQAAEELLAPTCADALHGVARAQAGLHRVRDIIRSLQLLARSVGEEPQMVDVQACLEHAVTVAFNKLKYRARLTREYAAVPWVLASEAELAHVFLHLLLGATSRFGEGQAAYGEVKLQLWAEEAHVCLAISAAGLGLPPEQQASAGDPSTAYHGVGLGLGLPACRDTVEGLGGQLSVSEDLDQGTRVVVRLPKFVAQQDDDPARPTQRTPRPCERPPQGRVLVVDDEHGMRQALIHMLGAAHEVVTADDGRAAQTLLQEDSRFDVILCDLTMPQMSGTELHAWLVERHPTLAERVVFMTGGVYGSAAAQYLARAGNPQVNKPFDIKDMRAMVKERVDAVTSPSTSKTCAG